MKGQRNIHRGLATDWLSVAWQVCSLDHSPMQKPLAATLVHCQHARFGRGAAIHVTDGANRLGLFGQKLWWDSSTANIWLARACLPKPKAIEGTESQTTRTGSRAYFVTWQSTIACR